MPDATLHAEGDAAARIEAARAEMIASATEALGGNSGDGALGRTGRVERSFADQARASLKLAPDNLLLAEHARAAERSDAAPAGTLGHLCRAWNRA